MSWLQNQQLTTVCVGFILRTRTEWSLREDERPGRVGGKQGAYPQPTRPSLLDPGVSWRRTRNPGPARLRADRDLAPGPPFLPSCKAHRPGPIPRLRKRCSLGNFQMEGASVLTEAPGESGPRRPRVGTEDSCSARGQPSLAWGQDRLATVALASHTRGDRWVCRIIPAQTLRDLCSSPLHPSPWLFGGCVSGGVGGKDMATARQTPPVPEIHDNRWQLKPGVLALPLLSPCLPLESTSSCGVAVWASAGMGSHITRGHPCCPEDGTAPSFWEPESQLCQSLLSQPWHLRVIRAQRHKTCKGAL